MGLDFGIVQFTALTQIEEARRGCGRVGRDVEGQPVADAGVEGGGAAFVFGSRQTFVVILTEEVRSVVVVANAFRTVSLSNRVIRPRPNRPVSP